MLLRSAHRASAYDNLSVTFAAIAGDTRKDLWTDVRGAASEVHVPGSNTALLEVFDQLNRCAATHILRTQKCAVL